MTGVLAIANTAAGSTDDETVDEVLALLGTAHDVRLVRTSLPGELEHALQLRERRAVPEPVICVLGGDGSLHVVVDALHRRGELADVVVALVPMGTGNDFARTVGLSDEPLVAAQQVLDGTDHSLDLLVETTPRNAGAVVVNAVHLGIGAEASAAARPFKKWLGPGAYVLGAGRAALTPKGSRLVRVVVDDEVVTDGRHVLQVAISNAVYVGGGTALVPGSDPGDGQADVAVSYATRPLRRLVYVARLRRGTQLGMDDVQRVRGRRIAVNGQEFRCSADGELLDRAPERSWELLPGAWTLRS